MNGFQLNMDKVSNQLKTFLLKRSSMPLQRQEQIKESREPQIQALPSPFSKLHHLHLPSSTDPIFQVPPSPFSKLHRPHFPGSTVPIFQAPQSAFSWPQRFHFPSSTDPIFQAPPSLFSKLRRLYFPSSTVPNQLKSFLLKRSPLPLLRQDQNIKSKEIQINLQPKSLSATVISLFLDMN